MLQISASQDWHTVYSGATIGLLELSGVDNSSISQQLDKQKREIETRLKERYQGYTRQDFLALPVMSAYDQYYKQFKKTYHVLLQVESIVLKDKSLPAISPLVDVNFMAEVETLILTAGHDVKNLQEPVSIDVSQEGDRIMQMNGVLKAIRPGDMIMRDAGGISCSIIYGQDNRSPITPATTHALYVSYAPPNVPAESVNDHFEKIKTYVKLFCPDFVVEQQQLLLA